MQIYTITIKGFRNFKDATINLAQQTLIIGPNDIGKTNCIRAFRLLLDPGLSYRDLKPDDSDFYVHEQTDTIEITLKLTDVTEDCLVAKLGKYCSDTHEVFLRYEGFRDNDDEPFRISASPDGATFTSINRADYLRVLNLRYIDSNRDLFEYIRREKKNLLEDAMDLRTEQAVVDADDAKQVELKTKLDEINSLVKELSFIQSSTDHLNTELEKLAYHHHGNKVVFEVVETEAKDFIENIKLANSVNDNPLAIGGAGRNNQIYFALWATKNKIQEDFDKEVTIYCIEEPEAHLHPHQQRKLASYFVNNTKSQLFISTHSPQIASEFSPDSIVKLYNNKPDTKAASDGCGQDIGGAVIDFAHRMNILPAEAFFCSAVLLVEGVSEVLFYKALSKEIGIDLDFYNISVLSVEGVGFLPYVKLFTALNIDWIIRTDIDVIGKKGGNKYARGISIGRSIYEFLGEEVQEIKDLIDTEYQTVNDITDPTDPSLELSINSFREAFHKIGFYLAAKDLETDLITSPIRQAIIDHYGAGKTDDAYVSDMSAKKGENMFGFLSAKSGELKALNTEKVAEPLKRCKEILEAQ
ncbi:AAA family ATPase [Pontibacter sp. G13]|uniref:ATP-dependent nuclease n=1 Tax=Pontibacter sp. G13 TaxID=3074898 RepID=UPI00288B590A|nr:AAA family ATPase [Pontibacter sp. G13]WNJ20338.1 AAA family ATPase [Pontibacter sp. G13]